MLKIKKTIEYGLYLLVFLLPIQTRWIIKAGELNGGYSEYNTISLYGIDIILLVLLFLFIVYKLQITNYKLQINPKLQISNYWYFIAGLELFIFISIFFAPSKLLAIYGYIRFLLGVGLFWLIISAEYNKIRLLWSLIAGAILQAGLGIWQFLSQSSFAFKWLGIAEHKPFELGTSVVEAMGYDGIWERWLRAYGGLDHPNILGGFLAVSLLLLILFINSKPKITNPKQIQNLTYRQAGPKSKIQNLENVLRVTCYVLCVTALFLTFSRGAWAGFLAGLIAILIILFWQKKEKEMKKILEFVFTGAIIIIFLFNLHSNLVLTRLSKDTRLEIKSNIERLESYSYAKQIIKKHWLFGVGIGNYTLYNANLQIKCESTNCEYANMPSWYYQPVHNTFLLIWAETGILGLAGFLGIMLCVMRYALCKNKSYKKFSRIILSFSALIALTAIMLVDHWLWSLHFGVLFFWMIMGLIVLDFSDKECYNNQAMPKESNN